MSELSLETAVKQSRATLLAERNAAGHWEGELSTSALSTATALVALGCYDETQYREPVTRACQWLRDHQNTDGGWGDTTKSFSNISTTLLCWSALTRFGGTDSRGAVFAASHWIRDYIGSLSPEAIAETVKARYGRDRTFSVPILMLCAICGTLGPKGWNQVLQMPFPLAAFPRSWFAALRLPVVSYALPALIAIGYARWRKRVREKRIHPLWPRLSRLLTEIQPASGGFLEAAPLTSFVSMALISGGEREHPVVKQGLAFLLDTVRSDGSWPIDTNLATWATTLSVKALASSSIQQGRVSDLTLLGETQQGMVGDLTLFDSQDDVLEWLLRQQYREIHPFTNTPPGGWAWTDLSGGVPDADDTPGALLALQILQTPEREPEILEAAKAGVEWLLGLQNRDGGIPTFCRGWGALPFDRSSPDLTAHTLRAWAAWKSSMPEALQESVNQAIRNGISFLEKEQRADGSWMPLWFGNQHRDIDEGNPTYGTAMVLRALEEIGGCEEMARGGADWLMEHQNEDGGWGSLRNATPSSVEETALALSALAIRKRRSGNVPPIVLRSGVDWLLSATDGGTRYDPAPIGFYFAKLWYFERTYPMIWTHEALALVAHADSALTSSENSWIKESD